MGNHDRSIKVALNARAAVIRNVAGVVVSLATVPVTLRALGTAGYGTFQVLVSLGTLAAATDVGLGMALLTRVGQLAGANQPERIRRAIGGALMVVFLVVALISAAAIVALEFWDIPQFLQVPPPLRHQAANGLAIALIAFFFRMPLSVFSSAHAGLQLGDRLIRWNLAGSFLSSLSMMGAAVITKRIDLAIACQLAFSLLGSIGAARLGCKIAPATVPLFRVDDLALGWSLLRSGFFYYLLQLEVTIISGLDNLVIAKVVGVEAVALYSVAARVITMAFSLVYSVGASFWGGVSNAIGTGDLGWIRSEAARSRQVGALWMAVFAGGFAAVGVPVIALWTGGRLRVDPLLPAALGTYFALLGHTMIDASILNGAEKIRQQLATVGCDAILNLTLSVWLARHVGYVGVALGTLIAYSLCTFIPMQYFSWKMVVGGERPPFWTRDLSAMIGAVVSGFLISRVAVHIRGTLVGVSLGGAASLGLTLLLIRLIVGPRGLEVLVGTFRRGRHGNRAPGTHTA